MAEVGKACSAHGVSLSTTTVIPWVQLGAAVATGSHGTGWAHKTLSDQIVARYVDDMAATNEAKPVQDIGHPERHRRLSGAGVARERHVQGRKCAGERHLLSDSFDQQKRRDLTDSRLDRHEADQFLVELRKHRSDIDRLEFLAQVDGLDRRRLRFLGFGCWYSHDQP